MSVVFIVDLFYIQINKTIAIFAASNQHFTGKPEYIKHMILNTKLCKYFMYTTKLIYTILGYCTTYPFLVF